MDGSSIIICKSCSNGCLLFVRQKEKTTVLVSGNECSRGPSYAYSRLKHDFYGPFISEKDFGKYDFEYISSIVKNWSVDIIKILPDTFIQGSSERTLFRSVVEDSNANRYIIEQISPDLVDKHERISVDLELLSKESLPVKTYLKNNEKYVTEFDSAHWQLSTYVKGSMINREHCWKNAAMGKASADFLIELYSKKEMLSTDYETFNLIAYIDKTTADCKEYDSEIYSRFLDVYEFLKNTLYPVYPDIPVSFCHGDAHPMNMIWQESRIISVIDWEFCGFKHCLYDIALIIGCLGTDAPEARNGSFLKAFKEVVFASSCFDKRLLDYLPYLVLAQRFAWMSEWLRRYDVEMIEFELFYMHLLKDEITSS